MKKSVFFKIACGLLLCAGRTGAVSDAAYRAQVEQSWLQDLNPTGAAALTVTHAQITQTLTLLDRTVALHRQNHSTLNATQKAALKSLHNRWDNNRIRPGNFRSFFLQVRWLRREILLTNPQLAFEQILINRNPPTGYSHNGDQHLGRHSRSGPGLTLLNHWKTAPEANAFLKGKLPEGATRNPDLHFDAQKVVFAFCNYAWAGTPVKNSKEQALNRGKASPAGTLERRYFLYEAALDGSWVRQLTGTAADALTAQDGRASVIIEDNDPCYLPDGDIAFISTRSQTYGRCHGGRYNPAWVLHRCDAAGGHIRQLSFGNENEYEPSVIRDGRLVFSRWEYTNRHEMLFHMLWQCRPDGTGIANYYGNDTLTPYMVTEQTAIPGTHKVVATAMGHHQYNSGTTVIIDTAKGENGETPLTHLTPETPYPEANGWPKPHYSHPYPVSEHLFLVSRANHKLPHQGQLVPRNDRAIYLIDDFGGREFIYEDPDVASVSPIPVRPRKRPPVLPSMLPEAAPDEGTVFLQNVYLTRNDPHHQIKPGDVKALRINELGVQPRADRRECTPHVNVEIPKKVLGTVPVNPDGSACFNVPARTPIQLQALDADGRAILTEKTFWYLQPGEKRSCVGCHEPVGTSPDMKTMAGLMQQGPAQIQPAPGPDYPGGMAFAKTVQPVLDRYCIGCHGLKKEAGNVNLLYEPFQMPKKVDRSMRRQLKRETDYPQSYLELTRRGNFYLGKKQRMYEPEGNISEAFERFYARGCQVSDMILKNHGKVDMDPESRERIFAWMDLNAPANGDIFPGKNRAEDRRFDPDGLTELRKEIRRQFGSSWSKQPAAALVNVAFPQESRILMAPLALEAGGWGQKKKWLTRDDPGFRKIEALIAQSFVCPENENDMGWRPTPEKGANDPWIAADRAAYLKMIRNE